MMSVGILRHEYGLSQAAMTHALANLGDESLIISVAGKGSYVT